MAVNRPPKWTADAIRGLIRRAERAEAGRDAAIKSLIDLLGYVRRVGSFVNAADHALLWRCDATVATWKGNKL